MVLTLISEIITYQATNIAEATEAINNIVKQTNRISYQARTRKEPQFDKSLLGKNLIVHLKQMHFPAC